MTGEGCGPVGALRKRLLEGADGALQREHDGLARDASILRSDGQDMTPPSVRSR